MSLSATPTLPLRRTQEITVQHVEDETLLYDERTNQAYCLNATTAAVWKACDGLSTPLDIANLVSPGWDQLTAESVVRLALSRLKRDGLIEGYLADDLGVVSRRAMLLKGGAGLALMLPVIAVIAAPKAAQAYTGCFNCGSSTMAQQRRAVAIEQQRKVDQAKSQLMVK